MTTDTLGSRIESARIAKGLNMAQLAKRLVVKASTIKNWESDNSEPRANKLNMMAGVLGVTLFWLMTGDGENEEYDKDHQLNGTTSLMQKLEAAQLMSQKLNALLYDMEGDISRMQRKIESEA